MFPGLRDWEWVVVYIVFGYLSLNGGELVQVWKTAYNVRNLNTHAQKPLILATFALLFLDPLPLPFPAHLALLLPSSGTSFHLLLSSPGCFPGTLTSLSGLFEWLDSRLFLKLCIGNWPESLV